MSVAANTKLTDLVVEEQICLRRFRFSSRFYSGLLPIIKLALGPKSLCRMSLVCRKWQIISDNDEVWQELWNRDFFGVEYVKQEKYKDIYKDNYLKVKLFIESLPKGKELLKASKSDALKPWSLPEVAGLVSVGELHNYVQRLSSNDLIEVFNRSMQSGFLPLIQEIVKGERFSEIKANGPLGIGEAFGNAVRECHIHAMLVIIHSPRRDEIAAREEYGLIDSFLDAALVGNISALKLLMLCPRFNEITPNGLFSFGYVLTLTAGVGQVVALEFLMKCDTFGRMDANGLFGLGTAFSWAVQCRQVEAVQCLMENPISRFAEITVNGEDGFAAAFSKALKYGLSNIMKIMMNSEKFDEIEVDGCFGLKQMFIVAADRGYNAVINRIMLSPHFVEISVYDLSIIFVVIGKKKNFEMMKHIIKNLRFSEINWSYRIIALEYASPSDKCKMVTRMIFSKFKKLSGFFY